MNKLKHPIEGVYLVAGLRFHPTFESFLAAVEQALKGGVRILQLRVKDELSDREHLELSRKVRELTRRYNVLYVVNDRPDIALLSEADGLHLGPTDLDVKEARRIVGGMVIGRSSHNYEQAMAAGRENSDYLAVGPIYATDSKKVPDPVVGLALLRRVLSEVHVPVVAIGGIDLENLPQVLATGVGCFGLIRGIMAADNIEETARQYTAAFEKNRKN